MRGTILNYDIRNGEGIISGNDEKRYSFKGASFGSEGALLKNGAVVDFDVQGDEALSIFIVPGSGQTPAGNLFEEVGGKSQTAAWIFAFFLGGLGIHKFYLGYTRAGLIMLLVSVLGCILVLPPVIIGLIAFIEGVIYLTKSDEDFYRIYVQNRKEWF